MQANKNRTTGSGAARFRMCGDGLSVVKQALPNPTCPQQVMLLAARTEGVKVTGVVGGTLGLKDATDCKTLPDKIRADSDIRTVTVLTTLVYGNGHSDNI